MLLYYLASKTILYINVKLNNSYNHIILEAVYD